MLQLRYPLFWTAAGWLLVAAIVYETLAPTTSVDISGYDKIAHASSYFALMIWFAGLYPRRRYAFIALILIALGTLLDIAQLATPTRTFDLADIAANAIGVAAGFTLATLFVGGWCQRIEQWWLRKPGSGA